MISFSAAAHGHSFVPCEEQRSSSFSTE